MIMMTIIIILDRMPALSKTSEPLTLDPLIYLLMVLYNASFQLVPSWNRLAAEKFFNPKLFTLTLRKFYQLQCNRLVDEKYLNQKLFVQNFALWNLTFDA